MDGAFCARGHAPSASCVAVRQENSTAATAVARFRLETPSRIGILISCWAREVSSSLRPWRSVPKASTERGGRRRRVERGAVRIERQQRPLASLDLLAASRAARPAARSAGRRRPAERPDATGRGCPWSAPRRRRRRRPPARRRPCCRGRGDPRAGPRAPGGGSRGSPPGVAGRSAIAITGVLGASGESCSNSSRSITLGLAPAWGRGRGRARRPAARSSCGSLVTSSSRSAPNLSACLTGWKPSSTASAGSRRARPKRGISGPSFTGRSFQPRAARTRVGRDEARGRPPHHRDHR